MPPDDKQQQVEFQSPTTGARQIVSPEHWDEALANGYRPTTHIVMYDPSGNRGMVPKEQAGIYRDQGYSIVPPNSQTQFEKDRQPGAKGTGFLSGLTSAAKSIIPTDPQQLLSTVETLLPGGAAEAGRQAAIEGMRRATRPDMPQGPGYGATYKVANALSPMIPGLNPESQEKRADVGDTSGIVGENVVPTAATLIPYGAKLTRDALHVPPAERAANLYERTISPSGMKAEGQLESRQTFQQAAPYLAQQERQTPVLNKQTAGQFAGQDMGVMNYRQNAQAAAHNLWQQIEPRARMYDTALLEPTKSGVTTPQAINSTINPTEAQLNPGKVAGVQSLADFYNKQMTVGEALDRITELNNDKGVQAYEKALPDKQADLLKGDPTIEGKITAANTLRDQVFDSIEKHGNPEDANWIRKARSDYGAVSEVAKNLGNTQVPTPAPFLTRLANSTRLALSPGFAREYMSRPVSTLFDLNNPNRLAVKSSAMLGRSNLSPTQPPPVRLTPWNPDVRPSGPIVGPLNPPVSSTGGNSAPMITPPQEPVSPTGPGNNIALFPDIPSGQAPHATMGAGEVPNWPPKTSDWSPINNASPIPSAESTIPLETPYGPPNTQGPPPLPPGVTPDQWNAMPASLRNRFGFQPPTPGAYSSGGAAEVTPQGGPLPANQQGPTLPPTMPPTEGEDFLSMITRRPTGTPEEPPPSPEVQHADRIAQYRRITKQKNPPYTSPTP